jgi:dipeptide/tripeptide permease
MLEKVTGLLRDPKQRVLLFLNFVGLLNSMVFYTIFLLMPLYTTDPISRGGLGLDVATAFGNYGTCFAFSFITPFIGGFLADLGFRRGRTLVLGYILALSGLTFLTFYRTDFLWISFWILVLGYGFIRTMVTALVGQYSLLLGINEQKSYRIFYLYLCSGFIFSGIIGGWVYTFFSFQAALHGLFLFLILSFLLSLSVITQGSEERCEKKTEEEGKENCENTSFFFWTLFSCVPFFCCYAQMNTSMNYYVHNHLERTFWTIEIPGLWINTIAALVVTVTAISTSWIHKKRELFSEFHTIRTGTGLAAVAFIFLFLATSIAAFKSVAFLWFFSSFVLIGASDLITRPKLYSAATTYVPAKWRSLATGVVYLTIGCSIKLGTYFAGRAVFLGFPLFYGIFFVIAFLYFLVLMCMERRFSRKKTIASSVEID